MTLPYLLRLGLHKYDITEVDDEAGSVVDYYGKIDHKNREVCICRDMASSLKAEAVVHEATHAWLDGSPLTDEQQEFLANHLGVMVTMFIRDNPDLVKYIQAATA